MSNNTPRIDSKLYIKDIRVECSPNDGIKPELDGPLKLTIIDTPNRYLNLMKISTTTWKQEDNVRIPVPAHEFLLVVSSEDFGDLGHMHIDISDWSMRTPEGNIIRTRDNLKWDFEPLEDAPRLSLSFEVYNPASDEMRNKRTGARIQDIDPSELYNTLRLLPDSHPMKADGLNFCGDQFQRRFETTRNEGDIQTAIKSYEQAVACLSSNDPRLGSFQQDLGMGYYKRYETSGQIGDVDEAIGKWQAAVEMTSDGHKELPARLNDLGTLLLRRFERTGQLVDISKSIQLKQRAIRLTPHGHPDLPTLLNNLGNSFLRRFGRTGQLADISESIQLQQRAVRLTPDGHADLSGWLNNLGSSFLCRFERTGELADISKSIQFRERAVQLTPDGHPDFPTLLTNLGNSFLRRFERTGELSDISESIQLQQRAVKLTPDGHPDLPGRLNNLGSSFLRRFERTGELANISESIQLLQHAVQLTPDGHADLPVWLKNLGSSFLCRFERTGELADISQSIQLRQRAVQLTPDGHPDLPARLNNLGNSFFRRFERIGELSDISEAIQLQQRAIQLTPDGHADLSGWLNNLGSSFLCRFGRTGDLADIYEAIHFQEHAVQLTPDGHANLPVFLNSLGHSFLCRFERTGGLEDISESIKLGQRAVQLTPDGHADLPAWLNNLGSSFLRRFERTGELLDISESIQLQQRAVQLTPDGHADLPVWLNGLGNSVLCRFERTGELSDISESIQLQQRAIKLTPDGHANLPGRLNNLGNSFLRRFERTGLLADASESIQLQQRAVQLTPDGHTDLPGLLDNLGGAFLGRFERTGNLADLSESIQLRQRALKLTPDGHADLPARLNSLGGSFLHRFERTRELADLSQSIQLRKRAVQLTPDGHVDLPAWLHNLGNSFFCHFVHTKQHEALMLALSNFRLSAMSSTGPPAQCIDSAKKWALLSKLLPFFSPSDLLDAYERIVHLLSLITGLENTLKHRHDLLIDSSHLSTAAAATALSVNRPDKALEWLEQGRSIVWNQINQLRTPVDDLRAYNPALADEFSVLSRKLENAGSRIDPRQPGVILSMNSKISLQSEAHNHLKLAKERDELLGTIRNIPEFQNFLQPRKSADLMRRLPEKGFVVIINADQDRCDALVLKAGREKPMHIPLEKISHERATTLAEGLRNYLSSRQLLSRYSEEAVSDPRAAVPSKPGSRDNLVQKLLYELWTDLVQPILQALVIKVPDDGGDIPRIWWCPTGPLAFLPIHAAGIYDQAKGATGCCLADFAISSYIPTLSILDRLRSRAYPSSITDNGVLLVSQPDTPRLPKIPCTTEEVQKIRETLNKRGIRSALYNSIDATVDVVLESLKSFSCVHLACHASQEIKDPLESAIYLYDRPLKLAEIMKKDLPNADLAFMSACQTSAGDQKLPEEAVHLAAGMLAAGYRSVVATMWSISDKHAPQVAETFYENLSSNNSDEGGVTLDATGSARALHIATRRLREQLGDSTEALLAWIPYIHVGI